MKPILFSAPMVQAILAGRKTQTRRVVRRKEHDDKIQKMPYVYLDVKHLDGKRLYNFHPNEPGHNRMKWGVGVWSRYTIGEILLVRETWLETDSDYGRYYVYRASDPNFLSNVGLERTGWRSPIYMPRARRRPYILACKGS